MPGSLIVEERGTKIDQVSHVLPSSGLCSDLADF